MKHKITRRLVLYFTSVLIVFSAVVGAFFVSLFLNSMAKVYIDDLERRALAIAETLSALIQEGGEATERQGKGHGLGNYLRLLDDIAMSEIWVVDKNAQTVYVGSGQEEVAYTELPEEAAGLIDEVFLGKQATLDGYSTAQQEIGIMVGAPVYDAAGNVVAAVVLQTHAEGIAGASAAAVQMLGISLGAALAAGIILAVLLSRRFVRPLKKMEYTTAMLAEGHYDVGTAIHENDEIGSLAMHIDMLAEKLREAACESGRMEQMRRDFVANVSHELRTPVTVIRGSLEALSEGVVEEKEQVREYYAQMMAETLHLERMVNDLLELSRLQNPDYSIVKEALNLPDVVQDAVRSARRLAQEKRVQIFFENGAPVFRYYGDYARLRQMLMTVLHNAVKFSRGGEDVFVSAGAPGGIFSVSVRDQGKGIPREDIARIFERFYRTGESAEKGTGLGLAIAKEIAARHGIRIRVESTAGKGTEFTFFF